MKTYVFKVILEGSIKFIPIRAYTMLNAVTKMKSNGWKNFELL